MAKYLLLVLLLVVSMDGHGQDLLQIDVDPDVDVSGINLDLWKQVIVPIHDKLTIPLPTGSLRIRRSDAANTLFGGCGRISLGDKFRPRDRNDLNDDFYRALTHDYNHTKFLCYPYADATVEAEGFAMSVGNRVYRELAKIDPARFKKSASIFMGGMWEHSVATATGGGKSAYDNWAHFDSIAAKFDLLVNKLPDKNYRRIFEELAKNNPGGDPNKSSVKTNDDFLRMLDSLVEEINGVKPSTFFSQSPAEFFGGPDGTYLEAHAERELAIEFKDFWRTVSPINPTRVDISLETRENHLNVFSTQTFRFDLEVKNLKGERKFTDSIPAFNLRSTGVLAMSLPDTSKWEEGLHEFTVRACANNACQQVTNNFIVNKRGLEKNYIFVISARQIRLVDSQAIINARPGYYIMDPNGQKSEIEVTNDKGIKRKFLPDAELPQVVFFEERDQPYLRYVKNGADPNAGKIFAGNFIPASKNIVVPGSIATLSTWGATHTDPVTEYFPLPTSSCKGGQGETGVVFVQDGLEVLAPISYCSQRQLTIQVPNELRVGTAQACLELNSARSCLEVDVVPADPVIEGVSQEGTTLTIYAVGLGAVDVAQVNGVPAGDDPLTATLAQPMATLDGSIDCPITFSGLAPGFVGLYQVNCILPDDLQPGTYSLVLFINDAVSNAFSIKIS